MSITLNAQFILGIILFANFSTTEAAPEAQQNLDRIYSNLEVAPNKDKALNASKLANEQLVAPRETVEQSASAMNSALKIYKISSRYDIPIKSEPLIKLMHDMSDAGILRVSQEMDAANIIIRQGDFARLIDNKQIFAHLENDWFKLPAKIFPYQLLYAKYGRNAEVQSIPRVKKGSIIVITAPGCHFSYEAAKALEDAHTEFRRTWIARAENSYDLEIMKLWNSEFDKDPMRLAFSNNIYGKDLLNMPSPTFIVTKINGESIELRGWNEDVRKKLFELIE